MQTEQTEQTEREGVRVEREVGSNHGAAPVSVTAAAAVFLTFAIAWLSWLGDLRAAPTSAVVGLLIGAGAHGVLCFGLWRQHGRGRTASTVALVTFAVVLRALMLLAPPTLSDDVYRYRWDGKVQASGRNPYSAAPADPRLEGLRDDEWARINYPRIRTIYPPLAQSLFAVTYFLHDSLKAFQIVAAVGDLLVIILLAGLLRAVRAPPWQLALYALHPLPVVEFAGSGHFDAWAMAAIVGAFLAHARHRTLLSTVLLAVGVLLKTWPLILVPLFLRRRPRWHIALIAAVVGTGYALYYDPGMLQPWLDYSSRWRFNDGAFWILHALTGSLELAKAAAAGAGALLFLFLWRRDTDAIGGGYWLLLGFILLMPTVHPWYMLWALPLAAVAFDLGWVTLCSLAPLAYAILVVNAGNSNEWTEPLWPRFVIYGAGLLVWLLQTGIDLRAPAPGAPRPAVATGEETDPSA